MSHRLTALLLCLSILILPGSVASAAPGNPPVYLPLIVTAPGTFFYGLDFMTS
jgi:hypothetical protein